MADVQTHSDARIKAFHVIPDIFGIGIKRHIRPVQVNSVLEIVFLHFFIHIRQQFIVGHADDQFHAHAPGILKCFVYFFLRSHINGADGVTGHVFSFQLGMKSSNLFIGTV
ncbi:hypothetical protein SDC9_78117 [bioreactor metagenome]|uniref:Uncharacterized protein n=1 Tax=bioreactor metagenome TaxID=1076179 RepID=A0A644YUN7_9ZZZZ